MNNRTLGTIAMICAPALMIEGLINQPDNNLVIGLASSIFMIGWFCINIAMQRMQAIGTGMAAKIVLRVQQFGIVMAFLFGVIEAFALLPDDNLFFILTDMCWPLSMVFMIVVGIMAIRVKRWMGWQRFIPLLCAAWLPVAIVMGIFAAGNPTWEYISGVVGFGWTAVTWFILALIVRSNATLAIPSVETMLKESNA